MLQNRQAIQPQVTIVTIQNYMYIKVYEVEGNVSLQHVGGGDW